MTFVMYGRRRARRAPRSPAGSRAEWRYARKSWIVEPVTPATDSPAGATAARAHLLPLVGAGVVCVDGVQQPAKGNRARANAA